MPSGYTANIYEGTPETPQEFIWGCARAFGAMVSLRDEPFSTEVPAEFQTSDYHTKNLIRAQEDLAKYRAMSIEEADQEAEEEYQKAVIRNNEYFVKKMVIRERYQTMIDQVSKWQPPTEIHVGLKDFCMKQLKEGMDFDAPLSSSFYSNAQRYTGQEWLKIQIDSTLRDIVYHTEEYKKELERINERNLWVKQLANSLTEEVFK